MRSIEYPNPIEDIGVVNYRGGAKIGFTLRPKCSGFFRVFIWPDGMLDPDLVEQGEVLFRSKDGPPAQLEFDLSSSHAKLWNAWRWSVVKSTPGSRGFDDLAEVVSGTGEVMGGHFSLDAAPVRQQTRTVFWSCHQPYSTSGFRAVLQEDASKILQWYSDETTRYKPHIVWGGGDTGYSDGTEGTDFSNQVYEKGGWYRNPGNRHWLRNEYRSMYRHFWSFEPMRKVMMEFPHLFMWDDHEIHDGWGSEGIDFSSGNIEMFKIAREVAEEYILNAGPRVRPKGKEAHQAYVLGSVACFIFDTRSTRNYEAPQDRLISKEQFADFVNFLNIVQSSHAITDLVTCTTVPFVNMRTWVMELGSRAPNSLNDSLLQGVRDDIRDAWTSPGNIDTLENILGVIGSFMRRRAEIRVWNISGDIHVANAFEIFVPGSYRPIYQITSSAITNRQHAPEIVEALTEIGDASYIKGVGQVNRIWPTISEPNFLCITTGPEGSEARLKIWAEEEEDRYDLVLRV